MTKSLARHYRQIGRPDEALAWMKHATGTGQQPDLPTPRKCLVVDLDNTLWQGVVGEDRVSVTEPHLDLQKYLLDLKDRGVILAIASKNNEADALRGFEEPWMRLRPDDFAVREIGWDDKPSSLRRIAATLNIGLDALAFIDDSPTERELVRWALPEVDVIELPDHPSGYREALENYLGFPEAAVTDEDRNRTAQYQGLAAAAALKKSSVDMEAFYRDLHMVTTISPFTELRLPRIHQLVQKTNQFNLTTRRHGPNRLREFMDDPTVIAVYLEHADRFTDHGLVGVAVATTYGGVASIDTLLLSCRVISRNLETRLLDHIQAKAMEMGCRSLLGVFVPTAKNTVCADFYENAGFESLAGGLWKRECR